MRTVSTAKESWFKVYCLFFSRNIVEIYLCSALFYVLLHQVNLRSSRVTILMGFGGGLRWELQKVAVCRKVDMAEKATPGICSTSCVMRNLYCGRLLAFQSFYSCILCAKKTVFKLKWLLHVCFWAQWRNCDKFHLVSCYFKLFLLHCCSVWWMVICGAKGQKWRSHRIHSRANTL